MSKSVEKQKENIHGKERLPEISGLKGMAAVIVVLSHLAYAFLPAMQTAEYEFSHLGIFDMVVHRSPLYFCINGDLMVRIFWCTSGFLLTYLWNKERDVRKLRRRVINKYVKMVFPIVSAVLLAWVLMLFGGMKNGDASEYTFSSWFHGFYQFDPSFLGAMKEGLFDIFFYGSSEYDPILWTMRGEVLGGFFSGALLTLFSESKHKMAYYCMFFVITAILYVPLCCFVLGIIVAEKYTAGERLSRKHSILLLGIALMMSSFLPIWAFIPQFIFWGKTTIDIGGIVFSASGALLLFVVTCSDLLRPVLCSKVFRFLGKNSVAIFLIHCPLMCSVAAGAFAALYRLLDVPYGIVLLLALLIYWGILLLVCELFRRLVIDQWNKLVDKLWKRVA